MPKKLGSYHKKLLNDAKIWLQDIQCCQWKSKGFYNRWKDSMLNSKVWGLPIYCLLCCQYSVSLTHLLFVNIVLMKVATFLFHLFPRKLLAAVILQWMKFASVSFIIMATVKGTKGLLFQVGGFALSYPLIFGVYLKRMSKYLSKQGFTLL